MSAEAQSPVPRPYEVPPGHFHSPIPDLDELARDRQRIHSTRLRALPGIELGLERQLALAAELARACAGFELPEHKQPGRRYFAANDVFGYTDAFVYHALLCKLEPRRVIEVGAGFSSAVLLDANERELGGSVACTLIDPDPARLLALLEPGDIERLELRRERLQDVPLELFERLCENDVLFLDSSHVSKAGSDVNHAVFEVLPRLASGVWVHVHDIPLNFEYPPEWIHGGRYWNEAYLLRAFLQHNQAFEIALHGPSLAAACEARMLELLPSCARGPGASLWLRRR